LYQCLLATLALSLMATAQAQASARVEGVPHFGHVFLIIGENTDYDHVDVTNAPYLIGTLRPRSAWMDSYYAATHWSEANYVAMVTGQFTSCEQQDGGISCHQDVDNLYHQLDLARSTWKVWLEGSPGKCDGGGSTCSSVNSCPLAGFYTTGNPPILFDDVEGPNGVWSPTTPSSECTANDVPAGTVTDGMSTFNSGLQTGNVAAFNMIIPNGCDDGEANCAPVNNRYTQFDEFLAREVPLIEASPAFGRDGVIVITYDEDQRAGGNSPGQGLGAGGHTVCAVISPMLTPGNYYAQTYSYSLLRTLQDGFAVSPYLGAAADVAPLPILWP
jgi:hypothetical protein